MKRLGFGVALLLLASAPLGAAPEPPQGPAAAPSPRAEADRSLRLGLEDGWRMALARSPRLQAALARVLQARETAEVAASPARPQATLSGFREQLRTTPTAPVQFSSFAAQTRLLTGTTLPYLQGDAVEYGSSQVQLEVRQLLFDGGQVEAQVASARASEGQAEAALVGTARDLRLDLEQAWLDLLEARSRLELADQALALSREQQKMTEARFEAGAAARADVVFARVPVARAELDRVEAGRALSTAQAALNRLLGLPLGTPLEVEEPPAPAPPVGTVEEAEAGAREDRPEVREARAALEAARKGDEAARSGTDPRLYAVGSTNGVGYNSQLFPLDYGWRVALEAQWSLLDGNRTVHEASRARARILEAEAQLREVEDSVALEVRRAWLEVGASEASVRSAAVEDERAEEALAMARGRYQSGVAVFLEVSQAQVDLLAARSRWTQAHYAALRARSRLDRALALSPDPGL